MQNFDFTFDLKNLVKQTPEHLKRTSVYVSSCNKVLKKFWLYWLKRALLISNTSLLFIRNSNLNSVLNSKVSLNVAYYNALLQGWRVLSIKLLVETQ